MSLMSVYNSMRDRFVEERTEREEDARRMAEIQQKLAQMEAEPSTSPALRSLVEGYIEKDESFIAREPYVREIIEMLDMLEALAQQTDWWAPERERHARVVEDCCLDGDRELADELRQIVGRHADSTAPRTRADLLAAAAEYLWDPSLDALCEESVFFGEAAARDYLKSNNREPACKMLASLVVYFHLVGMEHGEYYFASTQTALTAIPLYAAMGETDKLHSCLAYIPDNLWSAHGPCDDAQMAYWIERSRAALLDWTGHDVGGDFWQGGRFAESRLSSLTNAITDRFGSHGSRGAE